MVTGGPAASGRGLWPRFRGGAHVVACGRNEAKVEGAVFVVSDVRKAPDAERVIAKAVEHFGRLDVLINNAGGSPHVMAADTSPRFVEAIVDLNLLAPLWCAQSAHKVMAVQETEVPSSTCPACRACARRPARRPTVRPRRASST